MADNLTVALRSKVMRSIKAQNTNPELVVRRILHSMGFRYRLHTPVVPGRFRPDIVFRGRRKVILVHGCFWHVHQGCAVSHIPASPYWREKLAKNQERDSRQRDALASAGWQVLEVWECELVIRDELQERMRSFLNSGRD